MSIVALAGDWHGNTRWALARIAEVADRGVELILHLGDFGIWPGTAGRTYLNRLEEACAQHGVSIAVTPGNHEDWGRLARCWSDPAYAGQPLRVTPNIAVLPRGHRFELAGRSFVSLGGAPSVDLEDRSQGTDWWAEEMITDQDVAAVVEGGYADVMLAHDAPLAPYEVDRVAYIRTHNEWNGPTMHWPTLGPGPSGCIRRSSASDRGRSLTAPPRHRRHHRHPHRTDLRHQDLVTHCDVARANVRFLELRTLSHL